MIGDNVTKFILFTDEECIPCGLVKKYLKSVKDDVVEEIVFYENLDVAEKYNVGFTPTLVVVDNDDNVLESFRGGMQITQNLRKTKAKYRVS